MTDKNKKRFYNLSVVTKRVQQILQPHIGTLFWVKAEISSGKMRGGSFYCNLVESNKDGAIIAQVRCTIWKRDLDSIKSQFKEHGLDLKLDDGTAVGLECCLQFHPQYGLSLKAVNADPAFALGELELKKKEILDRLTKEGLLGLNKQLMVPILPQRIGLITSKGSAAYSDILKTFNSSGFGFKILIADSNVQGLHTESSVLRAFNILEKLHVDLVIIARGGGSKTDLFYLDNELIARCIAGYKIPVWTGIGHETDISILDHVANRYFKTPTAVAEDIVACFVEMKRHLEEADNRFRSTWSHCFDKNKKWLDNAKTGISQGTRKLLASTKSDLLGYAAMLSSKVQNRLMNEISRVAGYKHSIKISPFTLIKMEKKRLDDKTGYFISGHKRQVSNKYKDLMNLRNRFRLESLMMYLSNEETKLSNKAATIRAADPVTSLKRGFSLVYTDDGKLLKSISQIKITDTLKTEVTDGLILSTVKKTERK